MDYAQLILETMTSAMGGASGGNVSGGISSYESLATRRTPTEMIARRYGCDRKTDHHSRTRCMLQGRIDNLKLQLRNAITPQKKLKIISRIKVWENKLKNELRKNRFRKD